MLINVAYSWGKMWKAIQRQQSFCQKNFAFGKELILMCFNFLQYLKNLVRVPRIIIKFDIVFYRLFGVIMVGGTRDLLQNFRLECWTRSTLAAVF